jgi:hypothetical protein
MFVVISLRVVGVGIGPHRHRVDDGWPAGAVKDDEFE